MEEILSMSSEGKTIVGVRLAERLGVTPPTVSGAIQRMKRDGMLSINKRKEISLTEKGTKLAINTVRRHRLAELFLTDILKIPWSESHQEACLLEHGISDRVMDRLYEVLGKPQKCPHGNPIPVDDVLPPIRGVPLDTLKNGETVLVERISEEATRRFELMEYLDKAGIRPGAVIKVEENADYAGTMNVRVNKRLLSLGTRAASQVWVVPTL